jgi:hypothetical protein
MLGPYRRTRVDRKPTVVAPLEDHGGAAGAVEGHMFRVEADRAPGCHSPGGRLVAAARHPVDINREAVDIRPDALPLITPRVAGDEGCCV